MPETQNKKKKQPNRYLVLTTIASQIGIAIFLGASLGKYIDKEYSFNKPWFTILLTILALIASLYNVIKQLNKLNKNDN